MGETVGEVVVDLDTDEVEDCVEVEDEVGLLELDEELYVELDVEVDEELDLELDMELEVTVGLDGVKKPTVESDLPTCPA